VRPALGRPHTAVLISKKNRDCLISKKIGEVGSSDQNSGVNGLVSRILAAKVVTPGNRPYLQKSHMCLQNFGGKMRVSKNLSNR
jgi:hypothetical protein